MRVTLCEVHEKQSNNLGKLHVSFSCPFCLIDASVRAESQLALAREGLEDILDHSEKPFMQGAWANYIHDVAQQTLAKLAETK
jgi:hypothetical protein